MERRKDENLVDFTKRVINAVKNKEIDYDTMGELLFGEKLYSSENLRKIIYGFNSWYDVLDNEYKYLVGKRILVISDLHVPFQLPVETFKSYRGNIDILIINGDVTDLSQISKFRGSRRNTPMEDIIETRRYLIDLISYINPKEVYATYGNHDIRFMNYLLRALDTDLVDLLPKTQIDLIFDIGFHHHNHSERTKIWYEPLSIVFPDKKIIYTNDWKLQIGDTIFAHPLAYNSGILKTSERAMDFFLRDGYDFKNLCLAHTHKSGEFDVGAIRLCETGCCCDIVKNNYNDGKLICSQKEGFLYMVQDNEGNTIRGLTKRIVLN